MIEKAQCFTVSPTQATMLPGDILTVTMTYEHNSLLFDGHHSIPLLMKLGKCEGEKGEKFIYHTVTLLHHFAQFFSPFTPFEFTD